MERKILLAVDGTQKGLESASIVGQILKDQHDLHLVLIHCMQQLSSLLPGEVCLDVEEQCKIPFADQEKVGNAVLNESRRRIVEAGFPGDRIEMQLKLNSMDAAHDILAEAENRKIRTIALGRRGRSQVEALLLGSVSGKVAQYAQHKTVWIVDTPVNDTNTVLIAMEGVPESRELVRYTAEYIAPQSRVNVYKEKNNTPLPPPQRGDGPKIGP